MLCCRLDGVDGVDGVENVQIVVMLDATDAMTSQTIEARHAYQAADIALVGDDSAAQIRRLPDGCLTVDYSCFRTAARGAKTLERAVADIHTARPELSGRSSGALTGSRSTPLADFASPDKREGASARALSHGSSHMLDAVLSRDTAEAAPERAASDAHSGLSPSGRMRLPGSEEAAPRYRRTTGGVGHGTHLEASILLLADN